MKKKLMPVILILMLVATIFSGCTSLGGYYERELKDESGSESEVEEEDNLIIIINGSDIEQDPEDVTAILRNEPSSLYFYIQDGRSVAQTFTAPCDFRLTDIRLKLAKRHFNEEIGDTYISLVETSNPSGHIINDFDTISTGVLKGEDVVIEWHTFDMKNVVLKAGYEYCMFIHTSGIGGMEFRTYCNEKKYSGGQMYVGANEDMGYWYKMHDWDVVFRLFGEEL